MHFINQNLKVGEKIISIVKLKISGYELLLVSTETCECGLSLCKSCLSNHTFTQECKLLKNCDLNQREKTECLTVLRLWLAQFEDRDLALR